MMCVFLFEHVEFVLCGSETYVRERFMFMCVLQNISWCLCFMVVKHTFNCVRVCVCV